MAKRGCLLAAAERFLVLLEHRRLQRQRPCPKSQHLGDSVNDVFHLALDHVDDRGLDGAWPEEHEEVWVARLRDSKESSRSVVFFFVDRLLTSLSSNDQLKRVDALGDVKSSCKDDRIKLVLHVVNCHDPSGSDTFHACGVEVDKLLVEGWQVGVGYGR